jgi:hypothetical protein
MPANSHVPPGPRQRPQFPVARAGGLPQIRRAHGDAAIEIILEPTIVDGEGSRHLWLGRTRMGKTFANKRLVEAVLTRGYADLSLIHDVKLPTPQYEGCIRESAAAFRAQPPGAADSAHVVFRGTIPPKVDDVAAVALELARAGLRVALTVDELAKATTAGGREWEAPHMRAALSEGGALRLSVFATTQIPQRLPTEALDLQGTIGIFAMDGRSLRYLERMDILPEAHAVIPQLQRGEFVLWKNGEDWDHTVYRFT